MEMEATLATFANSELLSLPIEGREPTQEFTFHFKYLLNFYSSYAHK
jgi:hypothetical protein